MKFFRIFQSLELTLFRFALVLVVVQFSRSLLPLADSFVIISHPLSLVNTFFQSFFAFFGFFNFFVLNAKTVNAQFVRESLSPNFAPPRKRPSSSQRYIFLSQPALTYQKRRILFPSLHDRRNLKRAKEPPVTAKKAMAYRHGFFRYNVKHSRALSQPE